MYCAWENQDTLRTSWHFQFRISSLIFKMALVPLVILKLDNNYHKYFPHFPIQFNHKYCSVSFWVCKLWCVQYLNSDFWVKSLSPEIASVRQQTRKLTVICVFKPHFQRKGHRRAMSSLEATGTSIRPSSGLAVVPLHIHSALFI